MDNTVFLVWNEKDYFYGWEPLCVRPCQMKSSMIRPIGKAFLKLHTDAMPGCLIKDEVMRAKRIVMTDAIYDPSLYSTLKKCCGEENVFLYCMNLIKPEKQEYLKEFPNRAFSFDREDARRFGIEYKHLPYSEKPKLKRESLQYDTLFLGMEKGRSSKIHQAAHMLEAAGLKAKIMVFNGRDTPYKIKKYIHYPDYLQYLSKSRTILEINMPGQTSCTLRFLESLFLKKKLITDNPTIIQDPYYDPENVFVLGKDDLRKLPDFVAQTYKDHGKDLCELTFENWLQDW